MSRKCPPGMHTTPAGGCADGKSKMGLKARSQRIAAQKMVQPSIRQQENIDPKPQQIEMRALKPSELPEQPPTCPFFAEPTGQDIADYYPAYYYGSVYE